MSKFAKIRPSKSPNVAEENKRSETPLSKRSIKTTMRPRSKPSTSPVHRFPVNAEEMFAPIAAQKVTKNARSKLIVSNGVT